MKITVFILIAAFNLAAASSYSQNITLKMKNAKIEAVFNQIGKISGYSFVYEKNLVKKAKEIDVSLQNASVEDAMNTVLKNQPLEYVIRDKFIVISPKADEPSTSIIKPVNDQFINITGVVKDTTGVTMPGVSVINKTTGIATITSVDGAFKIEASTGDILVFSFVGFISETVKVGTQTKLNITLREAINQLNDVVVTALGISKENRKIGYAVTKVDGNLLNQAKEPNVANSLTGRVSGLSVTGTNSGPGSSARILIRGISNFTGSTGPLFVINGVPMDNTQKGSANVYGGADMGDGISSINPDDIENIVVLKGSTASALYGTRASNGVIQITTKSGKGAKGFGVEFGTNFSLNSIIDNTDYQKAYGGGQNGVRSAAIGDLTIDGLNSWGGLLDRSPAIAQDGKMHPYAPVANQLSKFYRVAPVTSNTVSFVNGGDNGNMRLSLSQMDNESVIPNSNLIRYTGNFNLNQNITSKLKLIAIANYIYEHVKNRPFLNDMSRNPNFTMAQLPANIDPAYLKPGYNPVNGYELAMNSNGYQTNPWFAAYKDITNTTRNRLISSTALRYDFMKDLYVQTRVGLDLINDGLLQVEPTGQGYSRQGNLNEQSKAQRTELNFDILAGYSRNLVKDIDMDLSVGGNIRKAQYENVGISGSQFKAPFLYTASNLVSTTPVYQYSQQETNSAYYTLDLSFKKLLTLSTTGRYDVFSTLPKNSRGIFTPSVSTSFVFGNLLNIPKLDLGKLRVSYAQTSGEATPYQTSTYYQLQTGVNAGLPFGNTLDQIANVNDLKPYRLKEFEIGMELKWFDNRLGLDISYFNRRTTRELISKTISIATGYNSSYIALGSTANNGIELTLNGTPVSTTNFSWNASFNFTQVNNKLISIDGTSNPPVISQPNQGQYRPSVGPYNNGAKVANVQGLPLAQILAYDYKYDAAGNIVMQDGIPMRGDLTPMGSGLPKFYGGLNNDFRYKQYTLSFLVDYRFGSKVLSGTDFFSIYNGLNKSTLPGRETGIIAKGVNQDGSPNTTLVDAQSYYQKLATNVSTISVFDGSFVKLRQVTLGYVFPPEFLRNTVFQSIGASLVARNLLTLVKHTKNFDPEDSFSSLPGNAGLEGGGLPQTRTYGISLNFKFKK